MPTEWYCRIGDSEHGPFHAKRLLALAETKKLTESDYVRRGTDGEWISAKRVQGLFAAAAVNSTVAKSQTTHNAPAPPASPAAHRTLIAALIGFAAATLLLTTGGLAYYLGRATAPTPAAGGTVAQVQPQGSTVASDSTAPAALPPDSSDKSPTASNVSIATPSTPPPTAPVTAAATALADPILANSPLDPSNSPQAPLTNATPPQLPKSVPAPETNAVIPPQVQSSNGTAPSDNASQPDQNTDELRDRISPAVAHIRVKLRTSKTAENLGAGFVVAPNAIVTNYHLVEGARAVEVTLPGKQAAYARGFYAIDPGRDLILIAVKDGADPLSISDSPPATDDKAYIVDANGQLSSGKVLRAGRSEDRAASMIQTRHYVEPGASGSPLVDSNGKVIGVTSNFVMGGSASNVSIAAEHVDALLASARNKPQLWSALPAPRANQAFANSPPQQSATSQQLPTDNSKSADDLIAAIKAERIKSEQDRAAQAELDRISKQVNDITSEMRQLESEYSQQQTALTQANNNLTVTQQHGYKVDTERLRYDKAIDAKNKALQQAKWNEDYSRANQLQFELGQLRLESQSLDRDYYDLVANYKGFEGEINSAKQQMNKMDTRYLQLQSELNLLQQSYNRAYSNPSTTSQ